VLAGSPSAVIKVTLIWGKDASDRETVIIKALGARYRKFPLRYISVADTDDATLEITGTGPGSYHVGAVSLMPANNVEGFRTRGNQRPQADALRHTSFSGGNFVFSYEWRYAVGDIDKRPPIFDPVGTRSNPMTLAPTNLSLSVVCSVSIRTSPLTQASAMRGPRANWSNSRTVLQAHRW
jgi:alpha-N-arabinofuranosidase